MQSKRVGLSLLLFALSLAASARAQDKSAEVSKKLEGFDAFMEKTLKDWNAPGIGVGVVVEDKLVFAKGYGYRDYEKKLPITVEEGKLTWNRPIRESVPSIQFYNDFLNNTITLRDMLSHRTGITRHDSIWYKADYSEQELFQRLKYLEPKEPPREIFLYNNMMYAGVGYSVRLQSGKPWTEFVREKILNPLEMKSTVFSISDMLKQPDYGAPFTEKRDTMEIYKIPYYEDTAGLAAAGAIISNINFPTQYAAVLLVKPGHSTAECNDPAAVVRVSGDMTADQKKAIWGSATPSISGYQTLPFVGCSAATMLNHVPRTTRTGTTRTQFMQIQAFNLMLL